MGFDETVVHGCATVLCGIKPSALFSMRLDVYGEEAGKISEWNCYYSNKGIRFVSMQKKDDRMLFFVYDSKLLSELLTQAKVKAYLRLKGYPVELGFNAVLEELLYRLMSAKPFPHEVGVFLGYPLDDVVLFETGVKKPLFSGFWKVYSDISQAVKLMELYKSCSDYCMKLIYSGLSVPMAAGCYKKLSMEA